MNIAEFDLKDMDISVVKALLWEVLIEHKKYKTSSSYTILNKNTEITVSYDELLKKTCEIAITKGLMANPTRAGQNEIRYTETSNRMMSEAIWECVKFGILLPRLKNNLNCFYLTIYGIQALSNDVPVPCEPNGYLEHLNKNIPSIDEVIFRYAKESIYAYNNDLLLSATTSIGAAAEKSLLLLIEAFTSYLPTEKEKTGFTSKTKGKFIKIQFEEFKKSFDGHKGNIEKDAKELVEGMDIMINGIFDLLRKNRNDTGHPTGKELPKEEVFILLRFFITYVKKVYDLIDYFNKKRCTL